MIEFPVIPIPAGSRLEVEIAPAATGPARAEVEGRWAELCAQNPRLFDGPILALDAIEPGELTRLRARRSSYKHLAVQNPGPGCVDTGTDQLSITVVITAADRGGTEHVLLGQRGARTRIYPLMWELGPSGGVDPPPTDITSLTLNDLARHALVEVEEELAGAVQVEITGAPCLTSDPFARSYDVVLLARATQPIDPQATSAAPANWEYADARWIAIAEIGAFAASHTTSIIGPTLALFRHFRWT